MTAAPGRAAETLRIDRMSEEKRHIALVMGANRGIGFEVCRQLAERDFVVLLTARDAAKARSAAGKLGNVGPVEPFSLDVADMGSIQKAAAEVANRYGDLDVIVNNAGINYDTWENAENADINGTVMETITTNLLGPWRVCVMIKGVDAKRQSAPLPRELACHCFLGIRRGGDLPDFRCWPTSECRRESISVLLGQIANDLQSI
jgi:hypothetical protein